MDQVYNGMPAAEIESVTWVKSGRSGAYGNCVEFAALPQGGAAVRNSRHQHGPALVFTQAEIQAMVLGAKDGDFDHLLG
jgi:hypothetical protein